MLWILLEADEPAAPITAAAKDYNSNKVTGRVYLLRNGLWYCSVGLDGPSSRSLQEVAVSDKHNL